MSKHKILLCFPILFLSLRLSYPALAQTVETVATNVEVELKPCQRVTDQVVKYR
jgi:hypothetical protein